MYYRAEVDIGMLEVQLHS